MCYTDTMTKVKIWKKNELPFALLWIAVYMMGNSLSAKLSGTLGIKGCATAIFHLSAGLFLFIWIKKNGLMVRYGLCRARLPAKRFLWYIPLIIFSSGNLWNGVEAPRSAADAVFSICSMIGAGFLEELLFRGFLFRALSQNGVKRGAVISSAAFGLVHIVNLFNDRGTEFFQAVWQIIFATAFGFLCAVIFHRGKSLWPCILAHAAFNTAAIFAKEAEITDSTRILQNAATLALLIGYLWVLTKTLPEDGTGDIPTKTGA